MSIPHHLIFIITLNPNNPSHLPNSLKFYYSLIIGYTIILKFIIISYNFLLILKLIPFDQTLVQLYLNDDQSPSAINLN